MKEILEHLIQGQALTEEQSQAMVKAFMQEESSPLQIASLLTLLRAKQVSNEELLFIVQALRQQMIRIAPTEITLDIVGTGGDHANTINISTGSAILAASCGVKIAKHGNRAVSSQTGSADVLEALGININLTPEKIAESISQLGIGFCFAPNFHPAMMRLRQIRKELGIPTLFNVIGPLLNPALASHYLLGVNDKNLMLSFAKILQNLSASRSMIVHGNGLDELSCLGKTTVLEIENNKITPYFLEPQNYGLACCNLQDLQGGDAAYNAALLMEVFAGKKGAIADTLIFNAGVCLYLYGKEKTILEGIETARATLEKGQAIKLIEKWRAHSHAQ